MESLFLTVDETSVLLRKSSKWVYRNFDIIPGAFKLGGSLFINKEILLSSLQKRASKPKEKMPEGYPNRHNL